MSGDSQRKLPSLTVRFTLRSLLVLMLLACVFLGGRASMIPSLEAEKHRVTEARHAASAEIEKYERLERELQRRLLWENLRRFEEAERDNLRKMHERFQRELYGPE